MKAGEEKQTGTDVSGLTGNRQTDKERKLSGAREASQTDRPQARTTQEAEEATRQLQEGPKTRRANACEAAVIAKVEVCLDLCYRSGLKQRDGGQVYRAT